MWPKVQKVLGFLPTKLVTGLATCGPVGKWGIAPGTNGSVVGVLLYTAIFFNLSIGQEILVILIMAGMAILLCDEAERRLQKRDPGEVVLDEIVAVPLCFLGMKGQMIDSGYVWLYLLAGFFIFRVFDVVKPFGINRLQKYPGGLGVVLDDLAAAVATNITLWVLAFAASHGNWSSVISGLTGSP
ncbi:MAG: phosphatidylglycerophosphatase A [Puniceicoccaceae bacterium]